MFSTIRQLAAGNERIKNLYEIGPVQRAEVEDFAMRVVEECLTFIEPTQHHQAYANNYLAGPDGVVLLQHVAQRIKNHFETNRDTL